MMMGRLCVFEFRMAASDLIAGKFSQGPVLKIMIILFSMSKPFLLVGAFYSSSAAR